MVGCEQNQLADADVIQCKLTSQMRSLPAHFDHFVARKNNNMISSAKAILPE
jgi:hypothetical protein